MAMETLKYPKLTINTINNTMGNYKKTLWLTKSYLTKDSAILFGGKKMHLILSKPQKIKNKLNGFLLEILFCGFNYSNKRVKLYRPAFYCDVHRSEIFICKEAPKNVYKSRIYKRRLLFFSYDSKILDAIESLIKNFRLPNIYTGRGLYSPNDVYKIKKLKKRK